MHVDINSCFATIEQQANPFLRGKPVAVAAYTTESGCILTASYEAKRLGVKTGMQVREGKRLCRNLIVLPPDPDKYRVVNRKLTALLGSYTDALSVESIDEMVLSLKNTPKISMPNDKCQMTNRKILLRMIDIAKEIKLRIKREIGDWITVSIGISTNRYLAKVASGLQKPDGLQFLTKENIRNVFAKLQLEDLTGIKAGNAGRLRNAGIKTPTDLLSAPPTLLAHAFHSILGYHWCLRLHGWEDGGMYRDFYEEKEPQKSFGQSYALPAPYRPDDPRLWQIMTQLTIKMGRRLREDGFTAMGVGISLLFADHTHWHTQQKLKEAIFIDHDFYTHYRLFLKGAPVTPVRLLAIYCYQLTKNLSVQPSLFPEENKKAELTAAIDAVAERFGDFTVTTGRMLSMERKVLDRIAFGKAGI